MFGVKFKFNFEEKSFIKILEVWSKPLADVEKKSVCKFWWHFFSEENEEKDEGSE